MGLKENYLTVSLMNDIQNEFVGIQFALIEAGYTSPDVRVDSVYADYPPTKIKDLFNLQEATTQKIDAVVDWINPYSAVFEWGEKNGAIFNHVNRWWNWVEFNQKIIKGEEQKEQFLLNANNEQITDINGEPITTLEGFFKELI